MSLSYNLKKIIPAPIVTINKSINVTGDKTKLGTIYDITLDGTLVAFKGSPSGNYSDINNAFFTLSGDPPDEIASFTNGDDFNNILRKQEALRNLFGKDGKSLEWQPAGGQKVVKCNPRVKSVSFEPGRGQWTQGTDYSISLEADWIFINGFPLEDIESSGLLQSATESWSFQEIQGNNGSGFQVTHNVSAQGVAGFDENGNLFEGKYAWEHARDYVSTKISGVVDTDIMFAAVGSSGFIGGSFSKNTIIDETAGTFNVTEQWTIRPQNTFIQKTFNIVFQEDGNIIVTFTGNINAVVEGERSGSLEAITEAKKSIPTNAEAQAEITAIIGDLITPNVIPDAPNSKTIAINQQDGTITFVYTYNTSELTTADISFDAILSSDINSGTDTLTLNTLIQGKGETSLEKTNNAKAALLNDTDARTKAIDIIGATLLTNITISTTHRSKNTSINEKQGLIRGSISWDNITQNNGIEITVRTQNPISVFASIPIVGRAAGPVIQNMNTVTSESITVTVNGINQLTKPNGLNLALLELSNPALYLTVQNDEFFDSSRKKYTGTFRFLRIT